MLRPAGQRLVQFGPGADFDLDEHRRALRGCQRRPHSTGRGDVVVLDQHRVVQAHAVIGHARPRPPPSSPDAAGPAWFCGCPECWHLVPPTLDVSAAPAWRSPLSRCTKFSAVRSPVSSVRAGPRTSAITVPARPRSPLATRMSVSAPAKIKGSSSTPGDHHGLPRDHLRGGLPLRGTQSSVVMSPEPMSSASARRTASSTSGCVMSNVHGRPAERRAALVQLRLILGPLGAQRLRPRAPARPAGTSRCRAAGLYRPSAFRYCCTSFSSRARCVARSAIGTAISRSKSGVERTAPFQLRGALGS